MEVFARLMVLRLSLSRVLLVVHLVSQDLSIAGKRAGLAGERSGLFMEMIRVIKEMRDATNGECPKFAIWENVRGALSSNNGEDFRCVLEEFAHIVEADATIPKPSGKAENGLNPAQFPVMDGLWHGDSSMLNIGECPNVVKESRLSWILKDNVPQKYYLSARACQGILTRASRRGKALPELLKNALLKMIEWWEKKAFVLSET